MLQVRSVSLWNYVDVAKSFGLDGLALLRAHGIAPDDLTDPEFRLPARAVVEVLEESARLAGVDSFGLQLAWGRSFNSLGPLSLLLQHLPNLRAVIHTMIDLRRSISDVLVMDLQDDGETAVARIDLVPESYGVQALDIQVAVAFKVLCGASQGRWMPDSLCFAHKEPDDLATFRRAFRVPLQFDCDYSGFVCSSRSLDEPLPLADPTMADHARVLLGPLNRAQFRSMAERTRHAITLLLPRGSATLEAVAANLDTTPRALQRRLASEEHTFGALVNDIRRDLAKAYLANSARSLTEVAEDLGYANQSAFSRWFAAEFGNSPGAWRSSSMQQ